MPTAVSADLLSPPPALTRGLMLSLVLLVAAFIAWAGHANVQEVTSGQGRVIPASKVQVVQNLEGGIVTAILVREGALVAKGDIILRIDPTQADATLGQTREKMLGLTAQIARLEAEADGRTPSFPASLDARADLVARQVEQHRARGKELAAAIAAFDLLERQRGQEIAEAEARVASQQRALGIVSEELALLRPLVTSGAAARSELLSAEARLNEVKGLLEATQLALPRLAAAKEEVGRRRAERMEAARAETLKALDLARIEHAVLEEAIAGSRDKVERTTVRAPSEGIVKSVHVTTLGQVVQPGHNLVEIVPVNDRLVVEAQVRPQDIAFLSPGQPAMVKISAYDFALYGGLEATLEHIGADSITTEKGEVYYTIRVRTRQAHLSAGVRKLPIIAGMVAQVDVITGSKTVLSYLAKPLVRMQHAALRER